jgi:hypothetical protein
MSAHQHQATVRTWCALLLLLLLLSLLLLPLLPLLSLLLLQLLPSVPANIRQLRALDVLCRQLGLCQVCPPVLQQLHGAHEGFKVGPGQTKTQHSTARVNSRNKTLARAKLQATASKLDLGTHETQHSTAHVGNKLRHEHTTIGSKLQPQR